MLPGFRFLFAAIALSMSILIFGLGAAALLRAAHEEFASLPSWRAAPETMFAAPNDAASPVLATLRVEPPVAEQRTPDSIPVTETPAEPTAIVSPPTEPETPAALSSGEPSAETAKSAMSDVEIQGEAAAAQAEAPASAGDTEIAANETILSAPNEIAATAAEPTSVQALPDTPTKPDSIKPDAASTNLASTKIATLGGPPVITGAQPPTKIAPAKPDKDALKKRLQAQQALARRKAALRARVVQQAAQQPADPFAQPAATAARKR
jgi:hypothetical protein